MKALVLQKPGQVAIQEVPEPVVSDQQILLKVRIVGFCGSDLNSFRGLNPMVSFPGILGHEVCATIVQADNDSELAVGTDVAVSPYTSCGQCASCRRGRPNACQFNQTLGVQSRVGGGALARWPPSAAQTARTVFPYAAFTKTHCFRDAIEGIIPTRLTSSNSP